MSVDRDADRWRMLPAFLEKHQIDYVALKEDIDAALAADWQAALADRPEQSAPMLGFEQWAIENGFNPAGPKAWRKWVELHTAPVARPEPAQPPKWAGMHKHWDETGTTPISAPQEPAQPVANTLLRNLAAEVGGILGICEPELRQVASNTNVACLKRRLDEADAYLNAAPPSHPAPSEAGAERQER